MADKFNFIEVKRALQKELRNLPRQLAVKVKDDAILNFYRESFDGQPWQPRKEPADHPLLYDTGNLLSAVRKSVVNGRKKGYDGYELKVNSTYGLFHNEGTDMLPQRQFMGIHPSLDADLQKFILNVLDKHFQIK